MAVVARERAKAEEAAERWVRNMTKTSSTRDAVEHMSNVEQAARGSAAETPIEQTADFRNALFHGVRDTDGYAGLPKGNRLPRFMAIVNMTGVRRFYTSEDETTLIRFFAHSVGPAVEVSEGVDAVIEYARKKDLSVLLTYSMPYAAEVGRTHWDVRTVSMGTDRRAVDGELCYDVTRRKPCKVGSTLLAANDLPASCIQELVIRFAKEFRVIDTDVMPWEDDSSTGETETTVDKEVAKANILRNLMAQKDKQHEHTLQRLREELQNKEATAAANAAEVRKGADRQLAAKETARAALEKECTELRSERDRLAREKAERDAASQAAALTESKQKSAEVAAEKVRQAELTGAQKSAQTFKEDAAKAREELASLKKEHGAATRKTSEAHKTTTTQLEGKVRQYKQQADKLAEVVDTLSNEKEAITHQLKESQRDTMNVRALLGFAIGVLRKRKPKPKPEMRDAVAQEKNMEAQDFEICKLQAEIADLNVRHDAERALTDAQHKVQVKTLTAAVSDLEANPRVVVQNSPKRKKAPPPAGLLDEPPTEATSPAPTPTPAPAPAQPQPQPQLQPSGPEAAQEPVPMFGPDPNGDPGIEGVIAQAQCAINALNGIARSATFWRHNSNDLWSRLQHAQTMQVMAGAQLHSGSPMPIPNTNGNAMDIRKGMQGRQRHHQTGPTNHRSN